MDSDITLVLNRTHHSDCADPDYYFATVDLIEDGRSPTGIGPLTMSELETWEKRVKTGQSNNAEDQESGYLSANNDVHHEIPRENHRLVRQVPQS